MIKPRNYYKPFQFPWAYALWKQHESMHWMAASVPLHEDVRDWSEKLSDNERSLLTNLFRFFTQADIDVAGGYAKKFLPYFAGTPELTMMMSSFAAREAVHIDAYASLIETLGMPEATYQQFHDYKEMRDKHNFIEKFGTDTPLDVLKTLAVYSGFTEGVQLFGSFVVLLNFARFGKMKNMGNIIAWSIRDEDLHVEGMTRLFNECFTAYKASFGEYWEDRILACNTLVYQIEQVARKMVELEDAFIDLIFKGIEIEGLTAVEVKQYIRYITNKRWNQLGFRENLYPISKNPLPWVDYMVNGEEHANFFEQKATAYSKAMTKGTMEDVQW